MSPGNSRFRQFSHRPRRLRPQHFAIMSERSEPLLFPLPIICQIIEGSEVLSGIVGWVSEAFEAGQGIHTSSLGGWGGHRTLYNTNNTTKMNNSVVAVSSQPMHTHHFTRDPDSRSTTISPISPHPAASSPPSPRSRGGMSCEGVSQRLD